MIPMKKLIGLLLIAIYIVFLFPVSANSQEQSPSFVFELSANGSDIVEVYPGDVITVTLKLQRSDADEQYTMYAMQDEIRYDSNFFEMIEDSIVLNSGIFSTDISMVDHYREVYMNYLSMSGGSEWDVETWIGSFQLRVIAESGTAKITNQDYLVSHEDGYGSFGCTADNVTIVVSTGCKVRFMTNSGIEIPDQTVQYGERIIRPEDPKREGYLFDGWYKDIHLTEESNFENDTVTENITLYAKWKHADRVSERNGFMGNIWWFWVLLLILIILFLLYVIRKNKKER